MVGEQNFKVFVIVTFTIFVSGSLAATVPKLELMQITSQSQWDSVMEVSKATGRPVFLGAHASWCGYCKKLINVVYADTVVARYFNTNYINISIDVDKEFGRHIAQKYGVKAYPTLLFLNGRGEVLNRINGYVDPSEMLSYGRRSLHKFRAAVDNGSVD